MKLSSPNVRSAFTLIEIMIVVAIIALLAAIAIPGFKNAINTAQKQACVMNQKSIDGAKIRWALENKQPATAQPTGEDLFGQDRYIEHKPDCPAGGAYALNSVAEKCNCSVATHVRE